MKFGQKITVRFDIPIRQIKTCAKERRPFSQQHDLYYEWRPYYIDYNLLKRELKVTNIVKSRLHAPAISHLPDGNFDRTGR